MQPNFANASIPEHNPVLIASCLSAMNDEVLVSAARSGDARAFAELYERHSKKVLPRIYRITKNHADAEDALQDAILRAFVHVDRFEGRSSFSSWLTRIATNSALMVLRKRRGGVQIPIEQNSEQFQNPLSWEPQDQGESPEIHCVRRESEDLLRSAIQRLPRIFRDAVDLQCTQECSTGEVATALGISESAAKSRLMRARGVLRRRLSGTHARTLRRPAAVDEASSSRMISKSVRAAAQGKGRVQGRAGKGEW
jgi:RNA polymerase sigma-70 factor, ECF subfamily